MSTIPTFDLRLQRARTFSFRGVVRDADGQAEDLTNAAIYMAIRADVKIDPTLKLTSEDPADEGWVTRIVIENQTTNRGQFTVTIEPADTSGMMALGDDDPWLYDIVAVLADDTEIPVVGTSKFSLYPQMTTVPA